MLSWHVSHVFRRLLLWRAIQHLVLADARPGTTPTRDPANGPLSLDRRWIRDVHGRALMLRGFNLSADAKVPPYRPIPDASHLDRLADWGMNCIRLVLVWEAIEPQRARYNHTYLDQMADLVRAAWQRGIYTIIDMHQDLFSRALGGSGAPTWAHPPARNARRAVGSRWYAEYVLNTDVIWALERFWQNADFIRDSFVHLWQIVARRFVGVEGVLGYDLLNEPATRFVPDMLLGRLDRDILPDFYRQVIAAIRAVDPHRLVFIQPRSIVAFGFPAAFPTDDDHPAALHSIPGLVYAPHLYEALSVLLGRFHGNLALLHHTLNQHLRTAARLRAGLIIGEFGVDNGMAGAADLYAAALNLMDRSMASWIVWNYQIGEHLWNDEDISVVFPDGRERAYVPALVRPFPRATAGTPLGLCFDQCQRAFIFTYAPDPASEAPTEIFVPQRHFGRSFDLRLSRGLGAEYDASRQTLLLRHRPDVARGAVGIYATEK